MGLIDPYIQQYHEEVKPQIMYAAHSARWYAEQMLHRLTCIHREMTIDRDPGEVMAVNVILPLDGASVNVFLVPAGEEYVLESMTSDTAAAVFMRLTADGNHRTTTSNAVRTEDVRFVGPTQIAGSLAAAGTVTPAFVQLRRLARRARPTQSGGQIETGLDVIDALREHDPLHSGIGVG